MRRLDATELEAVLDGVYATTAARWELDPLRRWKANNSCAEAALRRASNPADPQPLSRHAVEQMVQHTASAGIGRHLCGGMHPASATWLLELIERHDLLDYDSALARLGDLGDAAFS